MSDDMVFCKRCGGFVSGTFAGRPNYCTCFNRPASAAIEEIIGRHPEATDIARSMIDAAVLHQRLAELEARESKALACLKLIADENAPGRYNGIKTAGDWCAEQAREVLNRLKETKP